MTAPTPRTDNSAVLVTGGAGFIGCAISHRLAARGARVVAVDSLHPQVHPEQRRPRELHESVELVVADVTEVDTWDRLLASFRPTSVIHLAAETGTGQSLAEASRHGVVNVVGTTRMTDALLRHEVVPEHVVLSSSRAVYGEGSWRSDAGQIFYPSPRGHAQLERGAWDCRSTDGSPAWGLPSRAAVTTPAPTSVYGATKLAQEHVLHAWCLAVGSPLSVLRLQNVYGPGQSLTNAYTGIVTLFSQLARDGESIPLYEDGQVVRDFVYIDDVADALVTAWRARPDTAMRVLDVGTGAGTTIEELARSLAAHYSAPEPKVTGRFRDGDVRYAACDTSDTRAELAWGPAWGLEEGLLALQEWIHERRSTPR